MTSPCQLDCNQSSYYGLQEMWGGGGVLKRGPLANDLLPLSLRLLALLQMATLPLFNIYHCLYSTDFLSLSSSATAHPALRYPLYLSGEAHVHRLCGVIWGHAHTHHLAQRRPAHRARLCLWCCNRDQRVHELPANFQCDTEAQWKLHLHRQQCCCNCQLGKTVDCYW